MMMMTNDADDDENNDDGVPMPIHGAYLPMQVRPPASLTIFHSQHAQSDCNITHLYLEWMFFIIFVYLYICISLNQIATLYIFIKNCESFWIFGRWWSSLGGSHGPSAEVRKTKPNRPKLNSSGVVYIVGEGSSSSSSVYCGY